MRIDHGTLEESDTTDLGEPESIVGSGFGHPIGTSLDSVWVGSHDELVQLEPVDGSIVERFTLGHAVEEMAGTPREVWAVDRLARTLGWFSTDAGRIVETVALQAVPDAIAAEEDGDVWVLNTEAGTITPVRDGPAP